MTIVKMKMRNENLLLPSSCRGRISWKCVRLGAWSGSSGTDSGKQKLYLNSEIFWKKKENI
jgi:hypothetical protein